MSEFPAMHNLSRWLISHEAATLGPSGSAPQAAISVCERLRGPLSALAGADGYRALIGRALALTSEEVAPPGSLKARDDGSLEVSGETSEPDKPERGTDTAEWGAALVARLLGLLVTFIGEALTMRLVHDVWPDAPSNGIDFNTEKL